MSTEGIECVGNAGGELWGGRIGDNGRGEGTTKSQVDEVQPEISLNSVVSITSPKTFKLKGQVNGKEVIIMVDPGATHNFISTQAVEELGVNFTLSRDFGVSLGTGEKVQS